MDTEKALAHIGAYPVSSRSPERPRVDFGPADERAALPF
jgi:hypothetical protein